MNFYNIYKVLLHFHRSISMRLTVHEPATTLNGVDLVCILKHDKKKKLRLHCQRILEAGQ